MTIQEAIEYMRMYKGENVNGESHLGHAFDLSDEIIDMAIEALQRGLENVNADSCSEKPNESEPKTADSGSVDSETSEIKTDRTTSGDLISRSKAIRWVKAECNPYGKPTLDYESGIKVIEHLERMPSAQSEKRTEERMETHACDLIDRQAAIDEINKLEYPSSLVDVKRIIVELPSAQPDLDEWCTDCSEYDQERHCCPRFNRVIREALKDARPEVVHCRDCRYENTGECEHKFGLLVANDENFCSYGERREDNDGE